MEDVVVSSIIVSFSQPFFPRGENGFFFYVILFVISFFSSPSILFPAL